MCSETIQQVTEKHAKRAQAFNRDKTEHPEIAAQLIAESDGSMVPIVEIQEGAGDSRKRRVLSWKEYRLTALQWAGKLTWLYTVGYGSVDAAGNGLSILAKRAGFGEKTRVHGLGDGAIWVREQMERVFGYQAEWMLTTKIALKKGKIKAKLKELKSVKRKNSRHKGLVDCIRYIENRQGQFAYDKALAKGLPIGSGKIKSTHRNIIQQRMKKPGAWWKPDLAEATINLRILRANEDWDEFWQEEASQNMVA